MKCPSSLLLIYYKSFRRYKWLGIMSVTKGGMQMFDIIQKTFPFVILLWPVLFALFNWETILKLRHIVPSYHKCPSQEKSNQVLQYSADRKMWSKAHLLVQLLM